jgi:hypothetical protein
MFALRFEANVNPSGWFPLSDQRQKAFRSQAWIFDLDPVRTH